MFYDLFLTLCNRKKISPSRAAEEIGVHKSLPSRWKSRGLTPQGETLNKIADYFDVTVDFLLGNEKKPAEASDEAVKLALFGGDGEVTDEMWEEAKFAAQLIKARQERREQ